MNKLSAIRTFANPGFTPTKRTRVRNDRWFIVRSQNIERDPRCDYVGLGEGEYTQLLPGSETRKLRDARLNNCNAITEYDGPVFEVRTSSYGSEDVTHKGYFATGAEAQAAAEVERAKHDKWIADVKSELANHIRSNEAKPEQWREGAIRDCRRCLEERADKFHFEVKAVR
jgi:hypothetical protein